MVNYANGKIYGIRCHTTNLYYVGKTTKKYISSRLAEHVNEYKKWKKNNIACYTTSFKVLENGNYSIELIENVSCNDVNELNAREKYHINNNECVNLMWNGDKWGEHLRNTLYSTTKEIIYEKENKKFAEYFKEASKFRRILC
jgi:hypothetical protein